MATHEAGRPHDTPLTCRADRGRNQGILPVAEIMRRLVAETKAALSRAVDFG
jgi:hypothetical protein